MLFKARARSFLETLQMNHSSLIKISTCILLGVALSSCQSVKTTQAGAIGVERKQMMSPLVSEAQLRQSAAAQYQQALGEAKGKSTLNADSAMTNRVKAVAARLIPHTKVFRDDAPGWAWEVNVIQSDTLNAWCMPGGKIAFYSGIITKLSLNDDEIAAIMGHEIAHALREHSRERVSEQVTAGVGIGVLAAATGTGKAGQDIGGALYNVTFSLPNSRLHETEADRMGVELAARAGYNPVAAVDVWKKMSALSSGKSGPPFLSTHPSNESRIADLTQYSQRVMPLYLQAKR
jgi:predicted Zn-dependent protease